MFGESHTYYFKSVMARSRAIRLSGRHTQRHVCVTASLYSTRRYDRPLVACLNMFTGVLSLLPLIVYHDRLPQLLFPSNDCGMVPKWSASGLGQVECEGNAAGYPENWYAHCYI